VMEECCDKIQHKHSIYLPKRRASNWNVCCCLMQGAYDMQGLDDVRDLTAAMINSVVGGLLACKLTI
jgi:hypothetical protein